ncbi:Peroxidase superfamily protein [Raphanus sativus]|nr:Peroxidase superfamily protein [Raphanus sativus]
MGVYLGNYCYVMIIVLVLGKEVRSQSLKNGYYSASCPRAESIVRSTVESHFDSDPTISPGLLRLHFHDCFVQGCDGSVLIKGKTAEQTALANGGLRGFEVIDDAKSQLELECPGIVSCADILALAARDAVDLSSGPSWRVPTGRKDGRISLASEASNLPSPFDTVAVQKQKFEAKGLDAHDLVTLLARHFRRDWTSPVRTVVFSIHHPSYRILDYISDYLILSRGLVIHFGNLVHLEA